MSEPPVLHWLEDGEAHSALWRSESGTPPPKRVLVVDDRVSADAAYRLACEGTAMLWRSDYHNANQLLQALMRRGAKKSRSKRAAPSSPAEAFHQHRQAQSLRARTLGMLLLPLDQHYTVPLGRAPDVHDACVEAYGAASGGASVLSLRELLGLIGAREWRKKGVNIDALSARIHPHYGVFSPVRGEYIDLVAQAPLPSRALAFDIGTGTGVLAALLAKRGVARIIATEQEPRALVCARENIGRLKLEDCVEVIEANLFPPGRAPLIVCNPPWVPARPVSSIEHAVYDPDSRMLRGFLAGAAQHLEAQGEAWLILSDLAEHLGLRARDELLGWIEAGNLKVLDRIDVRPRHAKAADTSDPLYAARSRELTSLWRLASRS